MKIEQTIKATFTNEELATVNNLRDMFSKYDEDDWGLLTQCFSEELLINLDELWDNLDRIADYMAIHS